MNGSFLVDSNVLIYATLADDRREVDPNLRPEGS